MARALADFFLQSRESVEIFDTDAANPKLSAHFPGRATVIDLDKVRDQMSCSTGLQRRRRRCRSSTWPRARSRNSST
jgi:hypothetical protein